MLRNKTVNSIRSPTVRLQTSDQKFMPIMYVLYYWSFLAEWKKIFVQNPRASSNNCVVPSGQ